MVQGTNHSVNKERFYRFQAGQRRIRFQMHRCGAGPDPKVKDIRERYCSFCCSVLAQKGAVRPLGGRALQPHH